MAASSSALSPPPSPKRATGTHLYKYGSLERSIPSSHSQRLERLKTVILRSQLYVPNLSQLNDPADGRPRFAHLSSARLFSELFGGRHGVLRHRPNLSFDAQIAEGYILDYNIQRHGAEKINRSYKNVYDEIMSQYKVYCLSKTYDNMNLWAKYGDDHRGYCLEFANEGDFFGRAMDVMYGDFAPMDVTNDEHINVNWFFCKGTRWSNEEEVRVLLVPRNSPHEVIINPRCLTRMILGRKMPEDDRAQITEWAKQRQPELQVVAASWDNFENVLNLVS